MCHEIKIYTKESRTIREVHLNWTQVDSVSGNRVARSAQFAGARRIIHIESGKQRIEARILCEIHRDNAPSDCPPLTSGNNFRCFIFIHVHCSFVMKCSVRSRFIYWGNIVAEFCLVFKISLDYRSWDKHRWTLKRLRKHYPGACD